MAKTVGRMTLRWAEGMGRQSGALALSAAAVAALPFLDLVRPDCGGAQACQAGWDRILFIPQLLFIPAVLALSALSGSWLAQRGYERAHRRYFDSLEPNEVPEIPPGHLRPKELENELIGRTMKWVALAAAGATALFVYFAMTPIGRRACDPVRFERPTGLQTCNGPAQWSDALIAYEVWLFIAAGAVWAVMLAWRSRRFRPRRTRRGIFGMARRSQAHP